MNALFITGAQRSGTTLLQKLLDARPELSVLSQPFPLLFVEAKRAFLRTVRSGEERYPLGHLFLENRYAPEDFARFLAEWRPSQGELERVFAQMATYSGQCTRFEKPRLEMAFAALSPTDDFPAVVAGLDRHLSSKPYARWFGSKETIGAEFVPSFLDHDFRCAIILRDPRDVVASLNHGRGADFGGAIKPTLFNVRSWRMSVSFAIAFETHPNFHWCRYEDLVADPEQELSRLARRLRIDPDASPLVAEMLDDAGAHWRGNSSHGDHDGVSTSSVGIFRRVLLRTTAELIEAAALPELHLLGYETMMTRAEAVAALAAYREPYASVRAGMDDDAVSRENAALEAQRLERVSQPADVDVARWFLFPRVHARLAEAFRG